MTKRVLRILLGLSLLAAAYFPAEYAYGLSFWLVRPGRLGLGPVHVERWTSHHGLTLRGWQMYAGLGVFTLTALAMLVGGVYLVVSRPHDD